MKTGRIGRFAMLQFSRSAKHLDSGSSFEEGGNRWIFRNQDGDCMRFPETGLVGAKVIDPSPHEDDRGRFM